MRATFRSTLCAALLALASAGAHAQAPDGPPRMQGRDSLEQRVRQRMTLMVQRQLGLTDDQTRRLSATSRKFEQQHRDLFVRERQVRLGLREELALSDTARQAQVARLLDQMIQVQRARVDLFESEQKELATFMTPSQRARYFGMQEQIRRRVDEMREQGGRGGPGGPGQPGARRPGGPPGDGPVRGGVRRPPAGAS